MLERTGIEFDLDQLRSDYDILMREFAKEPESTPWVFGNEIGLTISTNVKGGNGGGLSSLNTTGSTGVHPSRMKDIIWEGNWRLAQIVENTEIDLIYMKIKKAVGKPYNVERVKLVRVPAGTALPLHDDIGYVYHAAIHTNPDAYVMLNLGDGEPKRVREGNMPMMRVYQVEADGYAYILDGTKNHAIVNAGREDVVHLVVETNRVHQKQTKWTGMTTTTLTGHRNFLDEDFSHRWKFD